MTPTPLDRKLLRDLWRMKWQAAAIALLIACGVSVMVMAFSAQQALAQAQQRFYADTRFADAFAELRRAPRSRLPDLAAIPGVTALDARVTAAGLMQVPGLARPALVRIIALPARADGGLNRIVVTSGRLPDPASLDEAVALQSFMEAAGVTLGQRLTAVVEGRLVSLRIVGAARSPEYVYAPSAQSFMPDDAHQAVLWAPAPAVDRAAGLQGGFNSLALRLAPGASLPAVLAAVDRLTAPYGGRASYGREDQPSHAFLEAELRELSISASILPPVFLLIAAALTHMVITRLVQAEREQIGLFKAFGYSDAQAAAPYVKLAAAIGLIGAAAGGLGGLWLGAAIVDLYRRYFRFPVLDPSFDWPAFALAATASVLAALAGSALAARRAARLSPAVAMQPPRPAAYRAGLLDRLVPGRAIDAATRMIVRNLERFPGRAVLTTLGLAASLALLVGNQFVFGSLDHVVDQSYYRVQRWSDAIGFGEARSAAALAPIRRLPGVFAAEPVRVVAVWARANGRQERTRLTGLEPHARLNRPLDAAGRPLALAGPGVAVSAALARKLALRPGDRIRLDILDGRAPSATVPVTALAEDYSGFVLYMDRAALNRLMGDGDLISGAQLQVAPDAHAAFYRAVEAVPQILGAASRDETVANWRAVMIESFRRSMTFYVGFAAAIAFGVAFNTSRIALSERARDLATLRVLGFEQRDCAYILLGELLILGLIALPLGLIGGNLLARGLVEAYGREDLRLPLLITAQSYAVSLAAYSLAIALAAALVGRRIWSLDMVSVLKTRE